MNIIVPMAGTGSRFEKAGFTFPKPLIEVKGQPMIAKVVENLNLQGRYIFLVQKAHYEQYDLKNLLNLIAPGCEIVQIDELLDYSEDEYNKLIKFLDCKPMDNWKELITEYRNWIVKDFEKPLDNPN